MTVTALLLTQKAQRIGKVVLTTIVFIIHLITDWPGVIGQAEGETCCPPDGSSLVFPEDWKQRCPGYTYPKGLCLRHAFYKHVSVIGWPTRTPVGCRGSAKSPHAEAGAHGRGTCVPVGGTVGGYVGRVLRGSK